MHLNALAKQHKMGAHIAEVYESRADLIILGCLILFGIGVYFFYLCILIIFFCSYPQKRFIVYPIV